MVRRRIYREHQVSDCLEIFFSIQFLTSTLLKKIRGAPKFAVTSQKKITTKIPRSISGFSAHLYGARELQCFLKLYLVSDQLSTTDVAYPTTSCTPSGMLGITIFDSKNNP